MRSLTSTRTALRAMLRALPAVALMAAAPATAADVNPCAAQTSNPCAARTLNPCAAKAPNPCNPCSRKANPCNPCGGARVDPARFKQPVGARLAQARQSDLIRDGEKLWNDRSLGNSGIACATCHTQSYAQMNATFAEPYPHYVAMPAQQGGVSKVNAAEMVNFCMIVPMQDEPLPWDSYELAALSAHVKSLQPGYRPVGGGAANPCNPCSMKGNPCNPCGAGGNPCNPCSKRGRW